MLCVNSSTTYLSIDWKIVRFASLRINDRGYILQELLTYLCKIVNIIREKNGSISSNRSCSWIIYCPVDDILPKQKRKKS